MRVVITIAKDGSFKAKGDVYLLNSAEIVGQGERAALDIVADELRMMEEETNE